MRLAWALACLMALPLAGARPAAAQTIRVVVVQVAGGNLYLSAGSDSGLHAGDTLVARRAVAAPVAGAFQVLSVSGSRALVGFLGAPFPVTRGDSLVVVLGAPREQAVARPQRSDTVARAQFRVRGRPSSGSIGVEVNGGRTITYGLGADPLRTRHDFASPAVRFRWGGENLASGTGIGLSLTAIHRTGPRSLFERQTSVRVYEAQLSQDFARGRARLSIGRQLSSFDHASGYWDGAVLRIGRTRGLSAGVAAGFEPERANETFTTGVPKYAVYLNLRTDHRQVRYRSDLSFHRMLPRAVQPRQSSFDWSQRFDTPVAHLGHDLEVGREPATGKWKVNRFQARASVAAGRTMEVWATAVSDQPPVLDTTPVFQPFRRERAGIGISHRSARFFTDLDFSVNAPRDSTRGYAAGAAMGLSGLLGSLTVTVSGNYFTFLSTRGVMASPSIEYVVAGIRTRLGYQFMLTEGSQYSVMTHGADLMVSRRVSSRVDWLTRIHVLYGTNLQGAGLYTSLDFRF